MIYLIDINKISIFENYITMHHNFHAVGYPFMHLFMTKQVDS